MNKAEFMSKLSKEINYSIEDCRMINDILEKYFFISKKNKEIIINSLCQDLKIDDIEATKIYDTALRIINEELKMKLKHPLGK